MAGYTFEADEYVVLKAQEVKLDSASGFSKTMSRGSELMLTNQNIVYARKGMTGKVKGYDVYPLANIRFVDGKPQVRLDSSEFMEEKLEISFKDGMVSFVFGSLENKTEIRTWINEISHILTGEDAAEDALGKGRLESFFAEEDLADGIGRMFGTFQNALTRKRREAAQDVSARCPSCNASVKGRPGDTVECPYCGTFITLS